ncbi:MAG: membrane protein insertion efficiency factor YidD [Burkholderiaceae bacterium]
MLDRLLIGAIRAYRFLLSPWVGHGCRFLPTCSVYSMEAIQRHGALRGAWMMLARLGRCHPFGGSGLDQVPEQFRWRCWCHPAGGNGNAERARLFTEPR